MNGPNDHGDRCGRSGCNNRVNDMDKPVCQVLFTHPHFTPTIEAYGDAMAAWGAAQEREKLKPLTDEQLMDLLGNCANGGWFKYHAFARAIENAHGVGH